MYFLIKKIFLFPLFLLSLSILKKIKIMAEKRTFAAIAREIKQVWGAKVYFGAAPYLEAMLTLETTDPKETYLLEDANTIVRYFLCNAATFRGEDARRLKAELKNMIGLC